MPKQITKTIVALLIDHSAWMKLIKAETIVGLNSFLDTLEREADDLVELISPEEDDDGAAAPLCPAKLSDVRRLTAETYTPCGGRALIDECFAAIRAAENKIIRQRNNAQVVIVLHTGSDDRILADPRIEDLQRLIARRKAEGWQFLVLGVEVDPYFLARDLALDYEAAISCSGPTGAVCGMTAAAKAVSVFARGGSASVRLAIPRREMPTVQQAKANAEQELTGRAARIGGPSIRPRPSIDLSMVATLVRQFEERAPITLPSCCPCTGF